MTESEQHKDRDREIWDALLQAFDVPAAERHALLCRMLGRSPEMLRDALRMLEAAGSRDSREAPSQDDESWAFHSVAIRAALVRDHDPGAVTLSPDAAVYLERLRSRGSRFDRYRIEGEIARGGMGIVHRATDLDGGRPVVVKRMLIEFEAPVVDVDRRARLVSRFLREAQITCQLDHPAIPPVHDVGVDDEGRIYYVMKYVTGEDLRDILDDLESETSGWTLERVVAVLVRVCECMQYAHDKRVVHRDLKPANIRVGRYGEVYVMDWGLAHLLGQVDDPAAASPRDVDGREQAFGTSARSLTAEGDRLGTPCYMSPEQASGSGPIGPDSDVYAVGAILCHALWGCPPDDRSSRGIDSPAASAPAVRVDANARKPPAELVAICTKAMACERHERYPSMAALAVDLRAFLENRVVAAHEIGAWAEVRKWVRRNRALASAAAAALLFLVAGLAASLSLYREARTQSLVAFAREQDADREREEVLRLADIKRLEQLATRQEAMWPSHPENAAVLREWLADARELVLRLPGHRAALEVLRAGAPSIGVPLEGDASRRSTSPVAYEWRLDVLSALVAGIEALEKDDPWGATIPAVERRLADALSIETESVDRHREDWSRAIDAIAADVRFAGFTLSPRVGFVPIGADPATGFQEFWHLRSGARPERDESKNLRLADDMGLVFVLLPGGRFELGAQKADPSAPNFDPDCDDIESDSGRLVAVQLQPFWISKYEMTQMQWERLFGSNPSNYHVGSKVAGPAITGRNPVESVSWNDCDRAMRRLGLCLPTEAQWEYACRGGRDTPWFFGRERSEIGAYGNVADATALKLAPGWNCDADITDGHMVHAPVGSFLPNPYGLHDVYGNVGEWCREGYSTLGRVPPRDGDGERFVTSAATRVLRGGSCRAKAVRCRSAIRFGDAPSSAFYGNGVRPAAQAVTFGR